MAKDKPQGMKLKLFQKLLLSHPAMTPTEAADRIYDCKDRQVASVIASQNLRKLKFSLKDIIERVAGMSDEDDLNHLVRLKTAQKIHACDIHIKKDGKSGYKINKNSNDFIEVDDNNVQLSAVKLSVQLKGHLKEKVELTGEDGEAVKIIYEIAKPPKGKNKS